MKQRCPATTIIRGIRFRCVLKQGHDEAHVICDGKAETEWAKEGQGHEVTVLYPIP